MAKTVAPTTKIKKSVSNTKPTPKKADSQITRHAANPEERETMIRETAYYMAERDGFPAGRESDYWAQAEAQVDQLLKH